MKVLFKGQIPKESDFPDAVEDVVEASPDVSKIAVSDGASESFDSKRWAGLLAARFVERPEISENWLAAAQNEYTSTFDYESLSWSKQAAYDRGSFATLLGVTYEEDSNKINVLSVGDSVAAFLTGGDLVETFPYTEASEFRQRPALLCTRPDLNDFLNSPGFMMRHQLTWPISDSSNCLVLCMTDALAEWAMRQSKGGRPTWKELAAIKCLTDFESLIVEERRLGNMGVDDTTLVTLSFAGTGTDVLSDTRTI